MSGVPAVKFVDLVQVICDIIGNRVYSAGQARGEVFQPPGNTNYLHINKQTMKMLKKLHDRRIFIYDFLHIGHNDIFHCLFSCLSSSLKHW